MIGRNVHYTFEEVIKDIDQLDPEDLFEWMRVICKYYLTSSDIKILDALRAKQEGRYKQRELSILFCIAQPHLSTGFKRLRTKIVSIYNFLRNDRLIEEYLSVNKDITERQHSLLRLVMAGNSFRDIAKIEKVSVPNVFITIKAILVKLTELGEYRLLVRFIHRYKGKFVKN